MFFYERKNTAEPRTYITYIFVGGESPLPSGYGPGFISVNFDNIVNQW